MSNEPKNLSPLEVMEKQVNAYNARDIEMFVECFTDDIDFIDLPENKSKLKGIKELRELFSEFFEKHPNLNLKIKNRIVSGNFVTDHEVIHGGRRGPNGLEVISLNEIVNGKIKTIWFAGSVES